MFRKSLLVKLTIAIFLIAILTFSFWKFSRNKTLRAEQPEIEQLQALPYTQWSEQKGNSKQNGVKILDPAHVSPGYNLYTNGVNVAYLMDIHGQTLRSWKLGRHKYCEYADLLPTGEIIAVCMSQGVVKIDRNSQMIWKNRMFVHHDVEPLPDGTFFTIRREMNREYRGRRVVFDSIQRISASGESLEKWETFDHLDELRKWYQPTLLDTPPKDPRQTRYDYFHLNTIERLRENPHSKADPRFREGNLLVCFRNVNLVAILDQKTMKIVWGWGTDILDWPHMPTMLPNGNILVLDNGFHRKFSRVVEINPINKQIVWEYKSEPKENFWTQIQGSAQRLSNGNTLICNSGGGYVFEVTPNGKTVWEFWNPEMKEGHRKTIYRFLRIPPDAMPQTW